MKFSQIQFYMNTIAESIIQRPYSECIHGGGGRKVTITEGGISTRGTTVASARDPSPRQ